MGFQPNCTNIGNGVWKDERDRGSRSGSLNVDAVRDLNGCGIVEYAKQVLDVCAVMGYGVADYVSAARYLKAAGTLRGE